MYKYLMSAFILLSLLNCDGASRNDEVEVLKAPLREHGYSNFNTIVIGSNAAFDQFIAQVKAQKGWNNKPDFLGMLENTDIDFDDFNLMLYRHTESSGSNTITVGASSVLEDRADIEVWRDVPSVGTDDVAYYAFVYKIKKTIETVSFNFGGERSTLVGNKVGENIAPLNCKGWNDGCNNCNRTDAGVACTKKACAVHDELYCKVWD